MNIMNTHIKILLFVGIFQFVLAQAPEIEWHKGYGSDNGEHIHEIHQTGDGGYIGIGQMSEGEGEGTDILVVKIDSSGEFMWQQIIGTKGEKDVGICVEEVADGYVIGGGLFDGTQQRYLAMMDIEGNVLWQRTYPDNKNGMIRGVDALKNGHMVITGYKNCVHSGFVFIADNSDGFIMLTDSKGEVLWEKPISVAQGAKVRQELDGSGFVICTTK